MQPHDSLGGILRRRDDHGRRVARHHAGEDGRVHDEDIVGAVYLGVKIHHGSAVRLAAVVETELRGA